MTTPRPTNADSRDPRVNVVAQAVWDVTRAVDRPYGALGDDPVKRFADEDGAKVLGLIEAAGLLVLDPDDALAERIARIQCPRAWDVTAFMDVTFGQTADEARSLLQAYALDKARALLNALAPNLPGGSE